MEQQAWLFRTGIALILASALVGLAIPHFAAPRLALSGHLIGLMQGMFLVIAGLVWPRLSLGPPQSRLAFVLLICQAIAAPLANLLAAAWGAGISIVPMAAGTARGGNVQEMIVALLLRSAGIALVVSLILILWGLRGIKAAS